MTDIINKLKKYADNTTPFHMPGHKRNFTLAPYIKNLGGEVDFTELDFSDDLYRAQGLLKESMDRASRLYGAKHSFYLTNGATCGILASVFAIINRGDRVVVARNCHISVFNALYLRGAKISLAEVNIKDMALNVSSKEIESKLDLYNDTKLVIITSPSYEGIVADIENIAKTVKKHRAKLLVDAAHGAHFGLCKNTKTALSLGADMEVKSLHKTLPALGSCALMQTNDSGLFARAKGYVRHFQTSSPSYVLLSSIDSMVGLIEKNGDYLFKRWHGLIDFTRRSLKNLKNIKLLDDAPFDFDRTKLVFKLNGRGHELYNRLKEMGIYLEMAMENYALALTGLTEKKQDILRLINAVKTLDKILSGREDFKMENYPPIDNIDYSIEYKGEEKVRIKQALNRILAENIFIYPPGIPLALNGSVITKELVDLIEKKGENLSFTKGGTDKINVYIL